jgi:radical SAM protein with 4Fe4S-binding SPASM domain
MFGAFDPTYRCNFRCTHCYAGHLAAQPRLQAGELGTERVVGLLSAAADAGCLWLLLSGGEPLLRDDFTQIYVAARQLGLIVTVFTNASLVEQAHLDALSEYPPHQVEVSIYGATEATYERVTGVAGSFRRAHRGIERLLGRGLRVTLKTMILRENAEEVVAMEAFAQGLGLRFRVDPLVTPRLNGDLKPLEQRIDPQRAIDIELSTEARRADLAKFFERRDEAVEDDSMPANRLYRCGAGLASFHIDPQGLMHPCLMSPSIAYNTHTMGFAAAWEAVTAAVDQATCDGSVGCARCPTIELCGYCPGLFALEEASPSRPSEYACRLGEGRLKAIGLERPERLEVAGARSN